MGVVRIRPSREILSGDSADVYFARAARILEREGLDPVVTMEVFARQDAVLCGIDSTSRPQDRKIFFALRMLSPTTRLNSPK